MDAYPVIVRFPMRWGDMDALGHANNARFFTWFESARIELFDRAGITADAPTTAGPILASAACDFLLPVRYPAALAVGARVARIGTTSFLTEYEVEADGVPVARGSGVVVMVDYASGTPVPIGPELRERLEGMSAAGG